MQGTDTTLVFPIRIINEEESYYRKLQSRQKSYRGRSQGLALDVSICFLTSEAVIKSSEKFWVERK